MILDATAGNRTMWIEKDSENIIYIDRQTELQVKPTIFCDNTNTPFKDRTFDTIFYDPPHSWGQKKHFYCFPRWTQEYYELYKDKATPRYYGWDIYDSRDQLVRHLYKAHEEFWRILKDDGILWLKWNEMTMELYRVLSIFSQWSMLLRLYVKSPSQTHGKHQTFWLALQKNKQESIQLRL